MNPLRRAALMRGAQVIAGGAAAIASLGKQQSGSLQAAAPYPSDKINNWGNDIAVPKSDPIHEARWNAAQPLRTKLDELYGYSGWSISRATHLVAESTYLPTLRSTAPWWQASVAMERQKRKANAIQTLQSQIDALMRSPLDKVQEMANEALTAFMVELNKP